MKFVNLLLISFLWALLFRWRIYWGHLNPFQEVLQSIWWVFVLSLSWDWVFISISASLCDCKHFSVFLFYWKIRNSSVFKVASFEICKVTLHSFIPACRQGQFLLETDLAKQPTHAVVTVYLEISSAQNHSFMRYTFCLQVILVNSFTKYLLPHKMGHHFSSIQYFLASWFSSRPKTPILGFNLSLFTCLSLIFPVLSQ